MKKYVVDIETNGLLYDCAIVWVISILDVEANTTTSFTGDKIKDAVRLLQEADMIIGHNWAGYDALVLNKLHGLVYDNNKVRDTMLMSNILNPDRQGGHSLGSYGEQLGIAKPSHEDWTQLSDEMIHRNRKDVEITKKVYDLLVDTMNNKGYNISKALLLEQYFSFIIAQQENNGWYIDQENMNKVTAELEFELGDIEFKLFNMLPLRVVYTGTDINPYKKDGSLLSRVADYFNDNTNVVGNFCKVSFEKINLNSSEQIKQYLYTINWKPTEWNYKKDKNGKFIYENKERVRTSPKITIDSLEPLESEVGKIFKKRAIINHRLKFITGGVGDDSSEGIRGRIRQDGRVGAGAFSCGTNTARVRHYGIVNVPKKGKPYGEEMRSLFAVPKGKVLAGADLTALENRIAGHFTVPYDKGEYVHRLEQEDPHQYIADKLGISRNDGKTLNYAVLYGASARKVSESLGVSVHVAQEILDGWWDTNHALKSVQEEIANFLTDKGFLYQGKVKEGAYILGIDGRPVFIRAKHSAINALFQSTGSICNKAVTVLVYLMCIKDAPSAKMVGNFHDEQAWELEAGTEEKFKTIFNKACALVTDKFKLNIALTGDVKFGNNWAETH